MRLLSAPVGYFLKSVHILFDTISTIKIPILSEPGVDHAWMVDWSTYNIVHD